MKQSRPSIEPIDANDFISSAMLEFMIDTQLAQMALVRGTTESIRSAATDLIEGCKRVISDITGIATRKNLPLPKSLDEQHETILRDMREQPDSDFDSAYRDRMASHHRQAITLFRRGQTIKVPEISAFASRALAMMEAAYRAYAS